jgi:Ca2+-binding RTX toxin-like protein
LTVKATHDALGEIRMRGDEIVVGEFLERPWPREDFLERPRPCSGDVPTATGTDTIRVRLGGYSLVDLRLDGGPFEPGVTPEVEGAGEIEVEFIVTVSHGTVVGTPGADEFQWVSDGARAGLNLNPRSAGDRDVDVTVKGKRGYLVAKGGSGNDRIVPAPGDIGPNRGVFAVGGGGNDLLVAPANSAHTGDIFAGAILQGRKGNDDLTGGRLGDLLYGGDGADRIMGTGGSDVIRGGRGSDLLSGGPGRDVINARDSWLHPSRDTVRCGAGRDRVIADRRDSLRGCEMIRRG